jgi:hemerythrin-like metal-binding protein
MKQENPWQRWAMGTARSWRDIQSLLPETGIDMVDSDHRILLESAVKLNLLSEDAGAGFSEELLERQRTLLQSLQEYTKYHFNREEELIQAIGAPNIELQKAEHAKIIQELEERSSDFADGRISVSPGLRRSIFSWIIDHISGTDYQTFRLAHLESAFTSARSWFDVRRIFRATGIDHLDAQHRSLVTAILELASALRGNEGTQRVQEILGRLTEITREHFSDEEIFMQKFNIPGLAEQEKLHSAFLRRLQDFSGQDRETAPHLSLDAPLVHELMMWLVDHVNGKDYRDLRNGNWFASALESRSRPELEQMIRATGLPLVDSQHREFIGKASAFCDLVDECKGCATEEMIRQFDDIMAFAARHFQDEEKLFPAINALRIQRHRDEHATILQLLEAYHSRLAEGRIGAAGAIRGIILGMWIHHTNGTDIDTLGSAVFDREAAHDA